jgi:hypothetical protein
MVTLAETVRAMVRVTVRAMATVVETATDKVMVMPAETATVKAKAIN